MTASLVVITLAWCGTASLEAVPASISVTPKVGVNVFYATAPMTEMEWEVFTHAVQECWNVGALSSEAMRTVVTVGFAVNRDGTPRAETVRQLSASGGGEAAARQAFEAARRAIIRCGARGFPLPAEKFEQWRDMEITFNPENMRIR